MSTEAERRDLFGTDDGPPPTRESPAGLGDDALRIPPCRRRRFPAVLRSRNPAPGSVVRGLLHGAPARLPA